MAEVYKDMKIGLSKTDKEKMANDIFNLVKTNYQEYEYRIDNIVNDIREDVNGLGQLRPSGVASSEEILNKTEKDGDVWVAYDNGYWYYWSASSNSYIEGGIFQTDLSYEELKEELGNLVICKNLIGLEAGVLYPVFVKAGSKLTMSTYNGSPVTQSSLQIQLLNKDKTQTDYFNFTTGLSEKTIPVNASRGDVYYIRLNKTPDIPMQVEIGDTKTSYQPYFYNPKRATSLIDNNIARINELKQEIKEFLIKEETKNLYDSSNVVSGILNLSTGLIESDDTTITSDYIYIEQGNSLFWSFRYNKLELSIVRVVFYDVNKNRIAGLSWQKSCDIPNGACYVRFSTSISNNNNYVMLEYNERTSSYKKYKKPYAIGHDTNHRELSTLISNFHNKGNLKFDIDFSIGMIISGLYDPSVKSRIVSDEFYTFEEDTIIIIGKGMICWLIYENDENYQFTTTNASKGYIIPAGTIAKLQFSVYPLNTSITYTDVDSSSIYKNIFIYSLKEYAYNAKQNNVNDTFVVSAHRGLSTIFPENTLTSIIQSKKLGLNCVEVDVKVTSDGQYVLGHNDIIYVNNTTMKGNNSLTSATEEYPTALSIANNTYETISQYDIGSWKKQEYSSTRVPLLSDVLKTAKKLNIDLIIDSLETTEKALYAYNMVLKYGMIEHVRFSASTQTFIPLLSIKALNEKVNYCGHAIDTSGIDDIYDNLKTSTNDVLVSVPYQYLTETIIEYAHNKNLKIGTYLVEDVNNALNYINYGIDYMFTNSLFYIPLVMELDCN